MWILGPQSMKFWSTDLSTMECNFGSSMMLTFSFLRWVFFLNFVLSWFWMVMVVFPFFHQPPKYFDWTTFRNAFARSRLSNALQVCVHSYSFPPSSNFLTAPNSKLAKNHIDHRKQWGKMYSVTYDGQLYRWALLGYFFMFSTLHYLDSRGWNLYVSASVYKEARMSSRKFWS